MGSSAELVKTANTARTPDEILRTRVGALLGVTPAAETALAAIDIKTVFDLAASRVFATAARLLDAERNPGSVDVRLGTVPGDAVDAPSGVAISALAAQPIAILKRIGPSRAPALSSALDTPAVRDLALWPPYRAAKELLADAFFPDQQSGFDRDAPADLRPQAGVYPTERVFHRKLLIDAAPPDLQGTTAIEQAPALDVLPGLVAPTGFQRLATGALLTFSQSWFSQGLTLGQLLHSTTLAPGESTRLAMIDWTRKTRASTSEDISESEQLANSAVHNRALNEVTSATATEFQRGQSSATSTSSTEQSGGGFGLDIGPLAIGGSSGGATTSTEAMTASSSFGARDLASQFAQSINDRSQQNASSVRSRRASIVREVSQEEHETISTRVVTNYNHMHALSVQYYEIVQAFRTTTQLERAERCLLVPLKLVNFRDPTVVERSRFQLAQVALTAEAARALAEFGTVKITTELPLRPLRAIAVAVNVAAAARSADTGTTGSGTNESASQSPPPPPPPAPLYRLPTSPISRLATAGWNIAQLDRLGRAGGRMLLSTRSNAVYVTDDALVIGFTLRDAQAGRMVVTREDGTDVALQDVTTTHAGFAAPVPITDLQSIAIQNAESQERPGALVLHLSVFGAVATLDVPIHLRAGGEASPLQECVRFDSESQMRDLVDHLEANKMYYSQAIFRTLDGPAIATLLARFTFRGVPLAQLVDQQPVAVTANFLVFKMTMPAAGDADDPRLADDLTAWRKFLTRTGLDRPVPKSEIIPLPSGGVFAEAVLGRFNAAERLDLERFWNWQDSPIPLAAPEIAAITAGSRAQTEDLTPGQLSSPVVSIQAPTTLPDPSGLGSTLAALQAANLFRDMSGLAQTGALAQTTQQVSAAGATAAEQQAGQNLFTVMDQNTQRMRIAAQLAAQMAGLPVTGSAGGSSPAGKNTVTERGGELREAAALDAQKNSGATPSAEEATFRNQQGTPARDLANKVVTAAAGTPDTAGASAPSAPTRGVGPKQAVPQTFNVVLQVSSFFADPAIFGPTPVKIALLLAEPGGKNLLDRSGPAAPTLSGSVTTSGSQLNARLTYTYEVTWPGPTPTVVTDNRSLGLTLPTASNRVDMAAFVVLDSQTVGLPGTTAPADNAALAAALTAQGVDVKAVPVKPTVAPAAGGGFQAQFKLLRNVALQQLNKPQ